MFLVCEQQACQIESYFLIELNVFAQIKSNRIQIESNDFFDFRYDSIRFDLDKNMKKKNLKYDRKWMKNSQNGILKGIVRYLY